jgi:tetrapyrrole methylase family protein/MazG family protein
MKKNNFAGLVAIMKRLRAPDGCPWDKKQTNTSILPYLIEEAYEYIEAVRDGDIEAMKEELGDVLLQVVFHAQIASDKIGGFDIVDVIDGISNKLIVRHPHIFGDKKGLRSAANVRDFWEKHKKEVKKRDSVLDGVPKTMPALLRSRRLISKAGSAGFKYGSAAGVLDKVAEETGEVKRALKTGNRKYLKEEIGDLLYAVTALAYYSGIDPEEALHSAGDKFTKRFKKIEDGLHKGITEKEMLALWDDAKKSGPVRFSK